MTTASRRWHKRYSNPDVCSTAAANHTWLAALGAPVPALLAVHSHGLVFEHAAGAHARPHDLSALARLLGRLHQTAYTAELHRARLDRPHRTNTSAVIPDFPSRRREAITRLLNGGTVPSPGLTLAQARAALDGALSEPACFYKDSNPRNYLIHDGQATLLDFDTVSLAPAGYDLAKLIVTMTMTYGPRPQSEARTALDIYNAALTQQPTELRPVPWEALRTWAQIHHILTTPYFGRGRYRWRWK